MTSVNSIDVNKNTLRIVLRNSMFISYYWFDEAIILILDKSLFPEKSISSLFLCVNK